MAIVTYTMFNISAIFFTLAAVSIVFLLQEFYFKLFDLSIKYKLNGIEMYPMSFNKNMLRLCGNVLIFFC